MVRYLETTAEEGHRATARSTSRSTGYKLRGRFALVKLRTNREQKRQRVAPPQEAGRVRDDRTGRARRRSRAACSPGLTVDELAKRAARWPRRLEELAERLGAPRAATSTDAHSRRCCAALEDRGGEARRRALAGGLHLRAQARRRARHRRQDATTTSRLTYRIGPRHDTPRYPEVARAVQALAPCRASCSTARSSRSTNGAARTSSVSRSASTRRPAARAQGRAHEVPVVYLVFDLLAIGGTRPARAPARAPRSELLATSCSGAACSARSTHLEDDGRRPARFLPRADSSRASSRSVPIRRIVRARSARRLGQGEVRARRELRRRSATRAARGARSRLGALDLGAYEGDELVVRGKVGSGLDETTIDMLLAQLEPLITKERLFTGKLDAAPNGRTLVQPELVVSVRYLGWTDDGHLRFPSFRGVGTYDRGARSACTAGPPNIEEPPAPPTSRAISSRAARRAHESRQGLLARRGLHEGRSVRYYEKISTVLCRTCAIDPSCSCAIRTASRARASSSGTCPGAPRVDSAHPARRARGRQEEARASSSNDLDALMYRREPRRRFRSTCSRAARARSTSATSARSTSTWAARRCENGVKLALELPRLARAHRPSRLSEDLGPARPPRARPARARRDVRHGADAQRAARSSRDGAPPGDRDARARRRTSRRTRARRHRSDGSPPHDRRALLGARVSRARRCRRRSTWDEVNARSTRPSSHPKTCPIASPRSAIVRARRARRSARRQRRGPRARGDRAEGLAISRTARRACA